VHELARAFGSELRVDEEWKPLPGHAKFQQLIQEAEAWAEAQSRPRK
jgi:hypothetical protein